MDLEEGKIENYLESKNKECFTKEPIDYVKISCEKNLEPSKCNIFTSSLINVFF
jgi:hypothetical protein